MSTNWGQAHAYGEFDVEVAELRAGVGALQDVVEGLPVLLDDAGAQGVGSGGCVPSATNLEVSVGPRAAQARVVTCTGASARRSARRESSSMRRSRGVPLVGSGGMTCGSRRSKVAASSWVEWLKWR